MSFKLESKNEGVDLEIMDNYGNDFGECTKVRLKENPNLDVIFIGINGKGIDEQCIGATINQAKQLVKELNRIIRILE